MVRNQTPISNKYRCIFYIIAIIIIMVYSEGLTNVPVLKEISGGGCAHSMPRIVYILMFKIITIFPVYLFPQKS